MIKAERHENLPNLEEIRLTSTEHLTIASSSFGIPYSNQDLINRLPESQREQGREIVNSTGMTRRYFRYVEKMPTPEQITEDAINAIYTLVTQAMEQRGWDKLDHLIVTSAFLPIEIGRIALQRLNQNTASDHAYRLACAGAVTGFVDSLLNKKLIGQNVALVSAEPLSALFDERHFTAENLHVPAIFGDKYTVLCYNTTDFLIPTDENGPLAKTVFIPDHGVIRLSPWYQFHQNTTLYQLPDHYEFTDGADSITHLTDHETIMALFSSEQGLKVAMSGQATAKHFIKYTPPINKGVILRALSLGIPLTQAVYHQPSGPVGSGIERATNRGLNSPLSMEFTLGKIGESNSSSATTIVAWQSMIENGLFNENLPFFIGAPGIGSAITAAIVCPVGL